MATENKKVESKEITVEEKLRALYDLQMVVSNIDEIKTLRGELPLEVQDLEDEIAGLQTRIDNHKSEIAELESALNARKNKIEESKVAIDKYKGQQDNVRNNREYDYLTKEIEFQTLEIELAEKHIREFSAELKIKKEEIDSASAHLEERNLDLTRKKAELDEIVSETKHEEEKLREKAKEIELFIESRLLTAFKRIRKNARNGLAVVYVQRDACGGCFNKIPPQRQLDIRLRKKIIVCEYCGRILVDQELAGIIPIEN
jgi:predicted  nucleic acid-binding Zn-ribbon protein